LTTTPLKAQKEPRAAVRWVMRHPVLTVVVIALTVRVLAAVVTRLVTDTYTIPDETLYLELGRNLINGVKPDEWYPGYGQSFYDSVQVYTAPLVFLFRIFGPDRIVGALFAAVMGTATAGLTTAIGLRFLRVPFAVFAGLVVALMPSQILFSAVTLREAHVWFALVLIAVAVVLLMSEDWRRLAAGAVLAAVALWGLSYLRDQTMLAAAWALALAALIGPRRLWPARVVAAVVIAAVLPWATHLGVGGYTLVAEHAGHLAQDRATLAVGANSAFGQQPRRTTPPPPTPRPSGAPATPGSPPVVPPADGTASNTARDAATRDTSVRADFRHLPHGLVDVVLRPFPWTATTGASLLLARVETLVWYLLYVLSVIGLVVAARRPTARRSLAFPALLGIMLIGIAALTQGNLGTAFRHRDQLVWVLGLCSAMGLQWLWLESRWARGRPPEGEPDAPERDEPAPPAPAAEHALSG
jgi:hypothetical protein